MKRYALFSLVLLAGCVSSQQSREDWINSRGPLPSLRDHVTALASEEMAGRATGSNGAAAAAAYIGEQFRLIGCETAEGRSPIRHSEARQWADAMQALAQIMKAVSKNKEEAEKMDELFRSLDEMIRGIIDRQYGAAPSDYFQEFAFGKDQPQAHCRNVVALVRGTTLPGEAVVVGAHYDHLGVAKNRVHPSQGAYYPGADDNASGVAVLLRVAEKIMAKPAKRTVVFVAFSGEEIGLWGSKRYVSAPAVPLDRTVAMINMDMVGRLRERKLSVIGVDTAGEFTDLIRNSTQLTLVPGKGGVGPSDHTSFYLKGVPVLHLFTGAHPDYHASTDTAEKLNYEGMEEISDFVVELIERLTDRPALTYQKSSAQIEVHEGEAGERPYLGGMPEYTFAGPGVQIASTMPGSPAEKAGLESLDIILAMDGKEVKDVNDYTKLLYSHKPGEKVTLKIKRGDQEIEIKVTLASRPKH